MWQRSHPFPRGLMGLLAGGRSPGSRAYPVAPSRAVGEVQWLRPCGRVRTGFPGHSGGSAPDSHRLPFATDLMKRRAVYRLARQVTVNLTRIYTKLGDGGETHLGDMSRVPKTHPRIEAYGDVDELNAQIGVALTVEGLPDALRRVAAPRPERPLRRRRRPVGPAGGRPRAAARCSAEQPTWLEEALRRGQRDARAAAARSCCPAARRRPRSCTSAGPCAGARSGGRSSSRTAQPGGRALPQPALRPAVHPQPRGQRRRRAALGARPVRLGVSGLRTGRTFTYIPVRRFRSLSDAVVRAGLLQPWECPLTREGPASAGPFSLTATSSCRGWPAGRYLVRACSGCSLPAHRRRGCCTAAG